MLRSSESYRISSVIGHYRKLIPNAMSCFEWKSIDALSARRRHIIQCSADFVISPTGGAPRDPARPRIEFLCRRMLGGNLFGHQVPVLPPLPSHHQYTFYNTTTARQRPPAPHCDYVSMVTSLRNRSPMHWLDLHVLPRVEKCRSYH